MAKNSSMANHATSTSLAWVNPFISAALFFVNPYIASANLAFYVLMLNDIQHSKSNGFPLSLFIAQYSTLALQLFLSITFPHAHLLLLAPISLFSYVIFSNLLLENITRIEKTLTTEKNGTPRLKTLTTETNGTPRLTISASRGSPLPPSSGCRPETPFMPVTQSPRRQRRKGSPRPSTPLVEDTQTFAGATAKVTR